jgi:AcrR family transcriptional regulator
MSRILDHARRELDEFGPVKFNIMRVIEESGVSKSSVYHHFGGRDGVISAVEVQRLIDERIANNALLAQILASVNSGEECLDVIEAGLHLASNATGRKNRSRRIAVVAAAQHIPVLTESLAEESRIADIALTEMLTGARDRGLINPTESLEDISRYMASMFIGRSALDTYESEEFDAAWIRMSMGVLRGFLQPSPNKKPEK